MKYTYYFSLLVLIFAAKGVWGAAGSFQDLDLRYRAAQSASASSSYSLSPSGSSVTATDDNLRKRIERVELEQPGQAPKVARTAVNRVELPILVSDDSQLEDLSGALSALYSAIESQDTKRVISLMLNFQNQLDEDNFAGIINDKNYIEFIKQKLINLPDPSFAAYLDRQNLIPDDTDVYAILNNKLVKLISTNGSKHFIEKNTAKDSFKTIEQMIAPEITELMESKTLWQNGIHLDFSEFTLKNIAYLATRCSQGLGVVTAIKTNQSLSDALKAARVQAFARSEWVNVELRAPETASIENITELFYAARYLNADEYFSRLLSIAVIKWAQAKPETRWAELNAQANFIRRLIYIFLLQSPLEQGFVSYPLGQKKIFVYNKEGAFNVSVQDLLNWRIRLNLQHNTILDLSNMFIGDLSGLERVTGAENINQLFINYNFITVLKAGTFKRFTKLKILELRYNKISAIDVYALNGLEKVITLDLSHNFIEALNPNALYPLHSLISYRDGGLILSENPIVNQPESIKNEISQTLKKVNGNYRLQKLVRWE